ncbi:9457_t:CDS:2, partial [Racocetra persica]
MTKCKKYTITLIFRGHLAEELYYGPFCHNWWISRPSEKMNNPCHFYPIRIQSKLLVTINEHDFIIEVGQIESEFGLHPSYICKYDSVQSEICKAPSMAITMVYQKIFQTKTNFSGPEVMGYDTPEVVQEYFHELLFQVFNYSFNKLRIWILGVGKSNNEKFNFTGSRFKFRKTFVGCDPDSVWNQNIPTCSLSDWTNEHLMILAYKYHLKQRTSTQVNWQKLFQNWILHEHTIIELRLALRILYSKEYVI